MSRTLPCPRRTQIVEAAERLFTHYGFGKTTVADIAREAGVAVGSVYLEFSSKDALAGALSQERYDAVLEAMRAATALSVPYAERVQQLFALRVKAFLSVARGGEHACELLTCARPAVVAAHRAFVREETRIVRELLEAGDAAGELSVDDPALAARALLRAYASFTPPGLFDEKRSEIERLLMATHRIVLRGLVARPGP